MKVDPEIQPYTPVQGISGTLKSIGSDTMNNLMTLWAEGYRKLYPDVQVEIEGKGSGTAPPALDGCCLLVFTSACTRFVCFSVVHYR